MFFAAANGIDRISWNAQTEIRRWTETVQWQLSQLFAESETDPNGMDWAWVTPVLLWVLRGLSLVVLGLGLYLLAKRLWIWLQQTRGAGRSPGQPSALSSPGTVKHSWYQQAQAAQARQDYAAAIQAIYMALLERLHQARLLPEDVARTDREYVQTLDRLWSLSDQPIGVRDDWSQIFQVHEALCYGGLPMDAEDYRRCQAAFEQLMPFVKPQ